LYVAKDLCGAMEPPGIEALGGGQLHEASVFKEKTSLNKYS